MSGPRPSVHEIRIGVIGVGSMGTHHAHTLARGAISGLRLAALCDIDPARARPFPDVPFFRDVRDLLAADAVDAVLIATPHPLHPPHGIAALRAGLHVLVEKPLAAQKAEAVRLLAAHRDPRQVFAAMFNQRTDPGFQAIRRLVRSGELGRIQRIQWTITDWFRSQAYYDSGGWRATWAGEGGGVLLNQCVHNLDLWQWIFGLPLRVRAVCGLGRRHRIEVEDEVTAIMDYADGSTGVLVTSTGEAPGVNRLEAVGDRGRLVYEDGRLLLQRNGTPTSEHIRTTREGYAPPERIDYELPVDGRGAQHAGVLQNFADAIRAGAPLLAPAAEGLASLELANAILMAALADRTVDLPLPAARYGALLKRLASASRFRKKVQPYRGAKANYLDRR